MFILTRQLTATAAAAAAVIGAGTAPALASASSTDGVTARTPLVAAITAQTPKIHFHYYIGNSRITDDGLNFGYDKSSHAAQAVGRVDANAAQYQAKLEWILGVDMQGSGDATGLAWLHVRADHLPAVRNAVVAEYRLSNFYIGQADSQLGISHPARTAAPFDPFRKGVTPPGPGTLRAPVGLAATIALATPVLQERLSDNVVFGSRTGKAFVHTNLAAARYYALTVSRMHVDAAQRRGQQEWVKGVQTQSRGDARYIHAKGGGLASSTIRRELKIAFGDLRTAKTELAHADALLDVHPHGPSLTLPHPVTY